MRKTGFRRILPIVFTAIDIVLVLMGAPPTRTAASYPQNTYYRPVAYQEGGGAMAEQFSEPPALKPVEKVAILLDMPAFIIPALIAAFLFPQSEMAAFYLSIPLVPFLWYGIGRWFDGILEYMQRLRLHGTLRGPIGIPAAGLLCVSALILAPTYHHRTADAHWIGTGMMLWAGLSLTIALSAKKAN